MEEKKQVKDSLELIQNKFSLTIDSRIEEMVRVCLKLKQKDPVNKEKLIIHLEKLLDEFINSYSSGGSHDIIRISSKAKVLINQYRKSPINKEFFNKLQDSLTSLVLLAIKQENTANDTLKRPKHRPHLIYIFDKNKNKSSELKNQLLLTMEEVVIFSNIDELSEELKNSPPEIIIFNITGKEEAHLVCKNISQIEKQFHIIILSQDGSFETRHAAIQCGADYFELQPINPKLLCERVLVMLNEQKGFKAKVLAVLRDSKQQKFYELLMKQVFFDVHILYNLSDILSSISSYKPDAVLMDVELPGISGPDLTRLIRQYKNQSSFPIIFITSDNPTKHIYEVFKAGGDEYFFEPIDLKALSKAIHSRALHHREITRISREDELTGLLNRRSTHSQLYREIVSAKRYEYPLCIVEIDVDKLKEINNVRGYHVGDQILKSLSMLLKSSLRESDHIGRVEEKEFLVIMPHTNMQDAYRTTERLRASFSDIKHKNKNSHLKSTFSAGIAQLDEVDTLNSLIQRASEGLYKAKTSGGNKTITKTPLRPRSN